MLSWHISLHFEHIPMQVQLNCLRLESVEASIVCLIEMNKKALDLKLMISLWYEDRILCLCVRSYNRWNNTRVEYYSHRKLSNAGEPCMSFTPCKAVTCGSFHVSKTISSNTICMKLGGYMDITPGLTMESFLTRIPCRIPESRIPDGEIENYGKSIFEIRIPNFC